MSVTIFRAVAVAVVDVDFKAVQLQDRKHRIVECAADWVRTD